MPSPESDSGRLYALLRANAGHIVRRDSVLAAGINLADGGRTVANLRDFYGCDIRAQRGRAGWLMLAGEYVGRGYIDYCAQEFEKGSK